MRKQRKAQHDAAMRRAPRPWWKLAASLLILLHISAVFVAPFTFATSSGPGTASPTAAWLMGKLRVYVDAAFLNHGYFFFAPNPGASHLVRCRLEFDDGREPLVQTFPDLERHWPRLLYHRHFMLAESLHGNYVPPDPPAGLGADSSQFDSWRERRALYERLQESIRNHIMASSGASRVELVRIEHRQPTPFEFAERRIPLDAAELYIELRDEAAVEILP